MIRFCTALLTSAVAAFSLAAAAQERYPTLSPDQLTPEQKAYVENLAKPPRNNTTGLKNPPFKVYMRSPELAPKLEAISDYVRWGTGLPPRLTELAIMITARQWSSQWIWRGHYRGAVRGGDARAEDQRAEPPGHVRGRGRRPPIAHHADQRRGFANFPPGLDGHEHGRRDGDLQPRPGRLRVTRRRADRSLRQPQLDPDRGRVRPTRSDPSSTTISAGISPAAPSATRSTASAATSAATPPGARRRGSRSRPRRHCARRRAAAAGPRSPPSWCTRS